MSDKVWLDASAGLLYCFETIKRILPVGTNLDRLHGHHGMDTGNGQEARLIVDH